MSEDRWDAADESEAAQKRLPKWQQMIVYQGRMTRRQRERLEPIRVRLSNDAIHAATRNTHIKRERITDNTLIRVGIELVLSIGTKLEGTNERQLIDSAKTILGLSKKNTDAPENHQITPPPPVEQAPTQTDESPFWA